MAKELETLRAVAAARCRRSSERWKQRASRRTSASRASRERHRAEIEKVLVGGRDLRLGGSDDDSPGGARERVDKLEQDWLSPAGARGGDRQATRPRSRRSTERLNAEKAAALTAQARRHAAGWSRSASGAVRRLRPSDSERGSRSAAHA